MNDASIWLSQCLGNLAQPEENPQNLHDSPPIPAFNTPFPKSRCLSPSRNSNAFPFQKFRWELEIKWRFLTFHNVQHWWGLVGGVSTLVQPLPTKKEKEQILRVAAS